MEAEIRMRYFRQPSLKGVLYGGKKERRQEQTNGICL